MAPVFEDSETGGIDLSGKSTPSNPCAKRPGDWGFEPPKVCGCRVGKVCKHYNSNMRAALKSSDSRREEIPGDQAFGSLVPTYFHLDGTKWKLVDPTSPDSYIRGRWRHRHKMAKRL